MKCAGAIPRPVCGASQCAVDVFLSRSFVRDGRPETLLGNQPELIAGDDGRHVLRILGGSIRSCEAAADPSECAFYWGWTGQQLDKIR